MIWVLAIVAVWLLIGAVTAVWTIRGLRSLDAEQAASELASKKTDHIPLQQDISLQKEAA